MISTFKHLEFVSCSIRTSVLMLLITCYSCLNAQTPPTRRYTSRDGLIADRITVIAQDNNGYMWMGSLFGLCKYDGKKFTTIQLPASQQNKSVSSLLAADDKLYAGFLFGGGLMQYDNGRVTSFTFNDRRAVSNDISGLFKALKGVFAVNPYNQAYLFTGNQFQYLFSLDSSYGFSAIQSMAAEANGRIWIGTTRGLLVFEGGEMIRLLDGHTISYTRNTSKGVMVVSSYEKNESVQLIQYNSKDGSYTRNILWQSPDLALVPFYGSHSGSFWCVDTKRGLLHISETGQVDIQASTIDGQTEIKYLFSDRENNLWLATDPGVLKISNLPVISYLFHELAPGGADILQTGEGGFYTTNSKHLYRIGNNRITKLREFRDKEDREYLGILFNASDGNVWVGAWNQGLWKLKYKDTLLVSKEYFYSYNERVIKINCSASDRNGNTWVAGINGIFHIRNETIAGHFSVPVTDATTAFITAIAVDDTKNIIWAGDNTGGIFKISYQPLAGKFTYSVIDHFDSRHGLEDTYIRSLLLDSRRNLWIGTRLGGIYLMNDQDEKNHRVRAMRPEGGISCTRVTDITEEKGESIWFATCDGLLQYSLLNGSWQKYGVSDGLLGSEIFSVAIDIHNQQVWAASGEGITNIQFNENRSNRVPPLINITGISILGREDTAALLSKNEMRLSSNENSIGFEFAAASYTDEKKIRYRYMLAGYDKDWSIPVATNSVNYLSLPFGDYTFKVLAWNGRVWSEHPAIFSFYITRPFYKSPWFIIFVVSLLTTSFYLVRTYRLKQKLKLEKLRLNIARDLHDDIGSALGSINLLSENANRNLATNQRVDEVASVFQKIGYSAQSVLDSMDDIIWAINPEKDSLADLLIRMREFAIPLLEAKNIKFDLDMSAEKDIKPSMEIKRNIYLIFKEAITNIIRHSASTHVSITVRFDAKAYEIGIVDDGKGFDVDSLNARNGLKNMRKRAVVSGAELVIDSVPGEGTTIRLRGVFT